MKAVIALGGSVLVPDRVDEKYLKGFSEFALKMSEKNTLAIVVGGGKTARRAIAETRKEGGNEVQCDYAGIEASRYNASVLSQQMGIEPIIPETLLEAEKVLKTEGIVIMGGTEPGHSTDAVAAMLAELTKADLIIKATDVDGVYDRDPQKHKDAKMLKELSADELSGMVGGMSQDAGKYELFDMLSVKILKRSGIRCAVLDGRDLKNLEQAINGKGFKGTIIK